MLPSAASEMIEYRRFKFTRERRGFRAVACDGLVAEVDLLAGFGFAPKSCLSRPSIIPTLPQHHRQPRNAAARLVIRRHVHPGCSAASALMPAAGNPSQTQDTICTNDTCSARDP